MCACVCVWVCFMCMHEKRISHQQCELLWLSKMPQLCTSGSHCVTLLPPYPWTTSGGSFVVPFSSFVNFLLVSWPKSERKNQEFGNEVSLQTLCWCEPLEEDLWGHYVVIFGWKILMSENAENRGLPGPDKPPRETQGRIVSYSHSVAFKCPLDKVHMAASVLNTNQDSYSGKSSPIRALPS